MPDENENNIAISELDEALDLTDSAQFPYTQNNGGTLTTFKARLTQIAAKIIEGLSFAGINLPTSAGDKTVENSINFLLDSVGGDPNGNISDEYDPTAAYVKGDLCIYENVLYICTAPTTGTFDPSKWAATTIDNVIGSLSTLTTTKKSSIVGAVNEVNDKVNAIGTIVQGSSTGGSAVFTRTWAAKASITLTKGVWIISARVLLQQDNNGYRAMNITASSGDSTPQCTSPAINGNLTALNMAFMQKVTSTSATFYLNGIHNSTQNSELSMVSWFLNAVRIA